MRMRVKRNGESSREPEECTEAAGRRVTPEFRDLYSRGTSGVEVGPDKVSGGNGNGFLTGRSISIAISAAARCQKEEHCIAEPGISHTASSELVGMREVYLTEPKKRATAG